jgi:ABC-type sugar transport system ATPase subunit
MPVRVLQMSAISKRFPGVVALDRVDFEVSAGEIVALVGENGAGKSTLMKILAGIHRADSGEMLLDGAPVALHGPADASRLGIGLIPQERELIDTLDVAGNVFLGREPARGGPLRWLDRRRMHADTERQLARIGARLRASTPLRQLSAAQQQLVAIVRALSMNARLLILDEPTSSLTASDAERLFGILHELRSSGTAIVYISHRLKEIERLADRAVVLRDGRNAGTLTKDAIAHDRLVQLMVGRTVERSARPSPSTTPRHLGSRSDPTNSAASRSDPTNSAASRSDPTNSAASRSDPTNSAASQSDPTNRAASRSDPTNTAASRSDPTSSAGSSARDAGRPGARAVLEIERLRTSRYPDAEISLAVHRGEVLGIAGLIGAGRSELAETICGIAPRLSGRVLVDGQPLALGSPRDAIRHGICLVPEDRRRSGVVGAMSVRENVTLPALASYARFGLIARALEADAVRRITTALTVKASSIEVPVGTLSGGNQQKVVLARWLALRPRVIVVDEPTQGVDVGAKVEIHRLIRGLADEGAAVIMVSSDIEEIVAECDRVAVMHDGRVTGILSHAECTPESIMQLAVA